MSPPPRAWGAVRARGAIRTQPEDFVVEERLGFAADGVGEHVLLLVEKRGTNTHWVARALAEFAGVGRVDVGYGGAKDRHAVVRQWFSVRLAARAEPDWTRLDVPGVRVVSSARHRRKLKRGTHAANGFRLRVRALAGDVDSIAERLPRIAAGGVPNYFGPQRYGHDNLAAAHAMHAGVRLSRTPRGFALSAARSCLFDAVLAARVGDGTWDRLVPGDAANLDGSGSFFVVAELDATLEARVAALDLHPTGPLWGRGEPASVGAVRERERAIAMEHADLAQVLEAAGMEQSRRALRMAPRSLDWSIERDELVLAFELPRGAYATTVLQELIELDDRGASDA